MWHVRGILSALLVFGLVVPPRTCCVLVDCCQLAASELGASELGASSEPAAGSHAVISPASDIKNTVAKSCCRLAANRREEGTRAVAVSVPNAAGNSNSLERCHADASSPPTGRPTECPTERSCCQVREGLLAVGQGSGLSLISVFDGIPSVAHLWGLGASNLSTRIVSLSPSPQRNLQTLLCRWRN